MGVLRAFIAISLSDEIHQKLEKAIAGLRLQMPNAPLRWVAARNIHLTLKFLGEVPSSNLELLKAALEAEAHRHKRFELAIAGLGAFPNNQKVRVVWVGIKAPEDLFLLQKGIETEASRLGYPREEKRFSPHLTLARLSRNGSPGECQEIAKALGTYRIDTLGAAEVRAVDLYRSNLQPGGAVYTRLASLKLGAEDESSF